MDWRPPGPIAPRTDHSPLDPFDINQQHQSEDESYRHRCSTDRDLNFIHSCWASRRYRIFEGLQQAGISHKRINRFADCGSFAWVEKTHDPEPRYRVRANFCHDRWCAVCAARKGRTTAAKLLAHADARTLRFLTLTLRIYPRPHDGTDSPGSLKWSLDRLHTSFRRLRATKLWKATVKGGAAFTEVKWSPNSEGWHVHLHALIEGTYLPHPAIRKHWLRITGDSHIVDIRAVRTTTNAVRYVTTYVSKSFDTAIERVPSLLSEAIRNLTQRHLLTTFGTWRGLRLRSEPDDAEWHTVMPLYELVDKANAGDRKAYALLDLLWRTHAIPRPIEQNLDAGPAP